MLIPVKLNNKIHKFGIKIQTMRNTIQSLAMMSAVIAFASCGQKKATATETETEVKTEQVQVEPVKDTVAEQEAPKAETKTVEGTVKEINNGKDGYTAKIETKDKEAYFVTISHSNLTNHEQYKSVKVGEILKVTGDFWKTDSESHITVREIN